MSMTSSSQLARPLRIGLIGAGTVGGGVYEIIMNRLGGGGASGSNTTAGQSSSSPSNNHHCSAKLHPIITKICVRDATKPRTFHIDPTQTQIVTDISSIINDTDIDLVVEVAGGTTFAKDAVYASLKMGKSVVTANKALIAENLDELIDLIHEVNKKNGVKFGYEASVCGGIPIIHTLSGGCYKGDIINEIMGICNGTTNYMLGKMEEGVDYNDVLKEAQALGFAEADPTADVEGHDVRAKIAILAKLSFGTTVPVHTIPCMGITNVSVIDFAYAKSMGCTIKLIGTATRKSQFGEHDGALSVYVSPKLVPNDHPLASATGCGNAVVVNSANLGAALYTGPGAGRYPTANSIVADIMRVADNTCPSAPFPLSSSIEIDNDYESAFYIRISFQDGLGIVRKVGEVAESMGMSIHSILQQPITDRMAADTVVTTEACKLSQVQEFCNRIEKEDFVLCPPVFMPMIPEY